MDLVPVPNWKTNEYLCKRGGLMVVKNFDTMLADGKNWVVQDRSRFERGTASDVWKRPWIMVSRLCVGISVEARFAKIQLDRSEQELSYCRRLSDGIDTNKKVFKRDLGLQFWFSEKRYANITSCVVGLGRKWIQSLRFGRRRHGVNQYMWSSTTLKRFLLLRKIVFGTTFLRPLSGKIGRLLAFCA